MLQYNKYKTEQLVLKIGSSRGTEYFDSTYTPYILTLETNSSLSEKEFLYFCNTLQKQEYKTIDILENKIRSYFKKKKLSKSSFVSIRLYKGSFLTLLSFTIGEKDLEDVETKKQEEIHIYFKDIVFRYYGKSYNKNSFLPIFFWISSVRFIFEEKDVNPRDKMSLELQLLNYMQELLQERIYLNKTHFFSVFEEKLIKFFKDNSFMPPKRIELQLSNKYSEKLRIFIKNRRVTEKEYKLKKTHYDIHLHYILDAKDLTETQLWRVSKQSILQNVKKTKNKKFKITIIGRQFPIEVENIYSTF